MNLEAAIAAERKRRLRANGRGHPYVYRLLRDGNDIRWADDEWCEYCAGWFGVPHRHHDKGLCQFIYKRPRPCACIDCVVAEELQEGAMTSKPARRRSPSSLRNMLEVRVRRLANTKSFDERLKALMEIRNLANDGIKQMKEEGR